MPNFRKRRFHYFDLFFPHKLTNIAGYDLGPKWRLFLAISMEEGQFSGHFPQNRGQPEERGHTAWHFPTRALAIAISANFKDR